MDQIDLHFLSAPQPPQRPALPQPCVGEESFLPTSKWPWIIFGVGAVAVFGAAYYFAGTNRPDGGKW